MKHIMHLLEKGSGFKNFNWEDEFKLRTNPELKEFAQRKNIQFISFKDIPKAGIQ